MPLLASLIVLTNFCGTATVDTLGACVVSYVPNGGEEVFAALPSGVGGLPLCWPWFQFNGPRGKDSPKHGIARDREFEVIARSEGALTLGLCSDAETRKEFPHDFRLLVEIRLEDGLSVEMTGENTGRTPFPVTEAFHPYLLRTQVGSLQDDGTGCFRVWNPDAGSHLKTQGLGPEDWRTFLCVENGTFKPEDAYTLTPGSRHTLRRRISPTPVVRDTAALQARIDAVSAGGGGAVRVSGDWTVASLRLKTGVALHLEEGARLLASTNYADYVNTPGENRGAVVWADGADRIALEGRGVVDGRGDLMPCCCGRPGRWRGVVFTRCRDVRIEDVTIRNAHSWGCYLKECDGVAVKRTRIFNHCNLNNDGLDVASKNVLIEDCDIDSEDDALVFKNHNPDFVVENVRVRNCRLSCTSSFIKIGTETYGGFRDLDIGGCVLDTRSAPVCRPPFTNLPGVESAQTGVTGISVQMVDGGFVENVKVSGIRMKRGIVVPMNVRLDSRHPPVAGRKTFLRNVLIEDVSMESPSTGWIASSITGASGLRPQGVTLRNVALSLKGCADREAASWPVLERAGGYPSGAMFQVVSPAFGFFVRHADDVRFENVRLELTGKDIRRPIVVDDAVVSDDAGRTVSIEKVPNAFKLPKERSLIGRREWDVRFFQSRSSLDGTNQPFYWFDPEKDGPVPLVVVLHSWGANCFYASPATTVADYCAKHGWAMLYPNFRGPNVRPEACGSDLAVQDILDAIDWAKRECSIDKDRIYIIGGSGGGHMALLTAGRHPEVFAGVAAFCPITDLARWQNDSTERKNHYARNLVSVCGGLPTERPDEYARRSPLTWLPAARKTNLPVYIATGIHDGHAGSVPVGHAIRAFNALADEKERISESDIGFVEVREAVPDHLQFKGSDPFYGQKTRVHLRATSANARLTLFEGGHAGNYPAGLDFLSRQRRGRPADMSLPGTAAESSIEQVTR